MCGEHVLQWFDWGAPLAGDDLHELKAAAVQLHVCGIVILRVDLARAQRTAVLGLHTRGTDRRTDRDSKSEQMANYKYSVTRLRVIISQ